MKTSALRRFLEYVTYDTRSDEHSSTFPSTPGQLVLLRTLVTELRALGLDDAAMDELRLRHGHGPGHTPGREHAPAVGFIAHVDTSPEMPGDERAADRPSNATTAAISFCPTTRRRCCGSSDNPALAEQIGTRHRDRLRL